MCDEALMWGEAAACAPLDDRGSPLPFRVDDAPVGLSAQSVPEGCYQRGWIGAGSDRDSWDAWLAG